MRETVSDNMADEPEEVSRDEILAQIRRRKEVEEQIQALGGILASNNVGMTEPLVDNEGYPRNDLDVYQVRHARHKIICLQNDFKEMSKKIETNLQKLHSQIARGNGADPFASDSEAAVSELSPIAKVNLVSQGSPAFHAGLLVEDVLLSFGSIDSHNFSSLSDIGSLVQRSQGSLINVLVRREGAAKRLALIPGPWSGKGLLGCNIVPYDPIDR